MEANGLSRYLKQLEENGPLNGVKVIKDLSITCYLLMMSSYLVMERSRHKIFRTALRVFEKAEGMEVSVQKSTTLSRVHFSSGEGNALLPSKTISLISV